MDIQIMEDRIRGLQANITDLRENEKLFHKAKGLDEEKEKAAAEMMEVEAELQGVKEELAELKSERAKALETTAEALAARMSAVLPAGTACFEISNDGVFIGWLRQNGARVPYAGLSGGQKVAFDQALCYALLGDGPKTLIMEAAELDGLRLAEVMEHLEKTPEDTQIILNTWHVPEVVPDAWNVVEVA